MPTYEYACEACNHQFERFQSITARPIRKCPACGRSKVRRLISGGAGFLFKGSGFYITDYRSESYKQAAKKETESSKGTKETRASDKSSEKKSETQSKKKQETA